ncbi:Bug family tripartite tricarboxylate transporter substrate binding protein [Variovorax sp. LjRoot178]|uniref:Bug family tripartite tricarboxylate transporter substrate binding protein n=1 Tax=Variovorax sp. LjRoot178 TaxID=3342277 RepID=UPI003ECFB418
MKRLLGAAAACVAFCLPMLAAAADPGFPNKPIRVFAGIAPGGTVDVMARLYAKELATVLGTPVIVENRPGAFQIPAIRTVLAAPADGYTLFFTNGSAVSWSPAATKDLPYQPFKDFTFIAQTSTTSSVMLTSTDVPFKSVAEMIAYSMQNKGKLSYGSAGTGTASHLKIEYLKGVTGLDATHIPYKSDADTILALQSKTVQLGISTIPAARAAITAETVRPLVLTSPGSSPLLPGVPGTKQAGVPALDALEPYSFYGFLGPAGMPKDVVDKLNAAVNRVSAMPDIKSRMVDVLGMEVSIGSPAEFRKYAESEYNKAVQFVKSIKP